MKRRSLSGNPQCIGARQIYILPSKFGLSYTFVMLTLTTGAINYQLNPAFLLVFFMISLGLLSLWESHRNLQGICVTCLPIADTEAGQPAIMTLSCVSSFQPRYALQMTVQNHTAQFIPQAHQTSTQIKLALNTNKRGHFKVPLIKLYSRFPLNLCTVWTYLYFDMDYYVYPKPVSPGYWPTTSNQERENAPAQDSGNDELYELKSVESPWIQASRIAWKIAARGQGWYLKRMTTPTGECWLFRLEDLPTSDLEYQLQQLSYWIQMAEKQGHTYQLDLKGTQTPLSRGDAHQKNCLRQLARYGQ